MAVHIGTHSQTILHYWQHMLKYSPSEKKWKYFKCVQVFVLIAENTSVWDFLGLILLAGN